LRITGHDSQATASVPRFYASTLPHDAGVTDSSGTWPVFPDGQRKERTNPESAAARREFTALGPPAIGVLRGSPTRCSALGTPAHAPRGAFRSHTLLEAQSGKLRKQIRFGSACVIQGMGTALPPRVCPLVRDLSPSAGPPEYLGTPHGTPPRFSPCPPPLPPP